ncbi:MAG: serpin family protein [Christensenellales bacterium]|jgi:serine protease inhibitor
MKNRGLALFVCVCLCAAPLLCGCAGAQAQDLEVVYAGGLDSTQEPVDNPAVSRGIYEFSLDIFRELAKGGENNVFLSPTSIAVALAMTLNGARNETAEQMQEVLRLQGLDSQDVNEGLFAISSLLQHADKKVEVRLSNALWANKDVTIDKQFIRDNKEYFGAMLANMDFSSPNTVETINGWVSESTNGKIAKILEGPIDPRTILFIMNAIYFEGSWQKPFKASNTKQETFYGLSGDKTVAMMHQSESFRYGEPGGGQMIYLPYGDGDLGMYVYLPGEGASVSGTIANLDAKAWDEWIGGLSESQGSIALPRFRLEYDTYLKNVLTAMGMPDAFSDTDADFSGIAEGASIKDIRHKAFVDVDEKGTRAAAVTSVEMRATAVEEPQKPFSMTVDRPFLFAIAQERSGTILFMGSVVDP